MKTSLSSHSCKILPGVAQKGCGVTVFEDENKVHLEIRLNLTLTQFLGSREKRL